MGYDQYETAGKREGANYWLYKSDPDGLMQSFSAYLEISAIGQGERRAMAERLGIKQRQQQNKHSRISLPVLFSIVEFSEPKTLLEGSDLEAVHLESCRIKIDELNEELIRYLAVHPDTMYELSPRKYEELVAELLRVMGYDVYLTQQTRDGGRDIAAVAKASNGRKLLTLVECKRHSGDRPVGIDLVQRFMWTKNEVRANVGMIATTSYFTRDAQEFQKKYQWDLNFHDFKDMKDWLNNYGKWVQSDEHHGIWLPNDPSL
jgi:restriction endonuclease Mrr